MAGKLLNEQYLVSILKEEGCTGSPVPIRVKMPEILCRSTYFKN